MNAFVIPTNFQDEKGFIFWGVLGGSSAAYNFKMLHCPLPSIRLKNYTIISLKFNANFKSRLQDINAYK